MCLGVVLGVAVAAMPSEPALAIVGGQEVPVEQAPWQAAVRNGNASQCGGVIVDASRVLTAGHCVTDEDTGAIAPPGNVQVTAGTSSVTTPSATAQTVPVANVRVHPYYKRDPLDDDIAVLELARPLTLGTPTAQAIALTQPGPKLGPSTSLTISGYGLTQSFPPAGSGPLRIGATVASGAEQCDVGSQDASAVWLCMPSIQPPAHTCEGDSGGPVTATPAGAPAPVLVGVISGGSQPECSEAFDSAADVSAPEIRAFIDGSATPPVAPRRAKPHEHVTLNDADRAGAMLTCRSPRLTGAPDVKFIFAHQPDDADVTRVIPRTPVQSGRSRRHALTRRDVGKNLVCIVVATNAGGTSAYASDDDTELRLAIRPAHTRPSVHVSRASYRGGRCAVSFTIRERGSVAGWSKVTARAGRTGLHVRALGHGRYRATGRVGGHRPRTVRIRAVSSASGRATTRTARVG